MSDGKTAVLTRKSPLEKFASFCGSVAAWLAALVLFGLAAASLIARMDLLDVSTLDEGKALRVGISLPELLLFVVLTALLAGLCHLLRGLDDQKKANRLIAGAAILEFALALWWGFSQQIYPKYDQEMVWKMAVALATGDFSAYEPGKYDWTYYQVYPFQGVSALFMEPFARIFGDNGLRAWSVFCAFSAAMCLLALCLILKELGTSSRTQVFCAILCLLFVPIPMYASFVYGTLPAPTMALWGGYGILCAIKRRCISWYLLSLVLFPLAAVAYQSSLIFIIACCIVVLFSGCNGRLRDMLFAIVIAVVLLAAPLCVRSVLQSWFFSRVPIPYSAGTPSTAHILMGLHSNGYFGPGGYDGSNCDIFWDNGSDTAAANAAAVKGIREYLANYLHHPKENKFFLQKTAWQWLDPWFEALTMNGPAITVADGVGWLATALGGGVLFAPVQAVLRALLTFVYLFSGVGTLSLRRKTDGAVWVQLLGIAFFGGFLFQLVWETKSRYCFPFFVFLLPLAAVGFTTVLRWAGEKCPAKCMK